MNCYEGDSYEMVKLVVTGKYLRMQLHHYALKILIISVKSVFHDAHTKIIEKQNNCYKKNYLNFIYHHHGL